MKNYKLIIQICIVSLGVFLTGCRGYISEAPPFHFNPNMDAQPKYKAQTLGRPVPSGTVAYGRFSVSTGDATREDALKADDRYYQGKDNGQFIARIPIKVDRDLLVRGQERFDIYCSACHDRAGSGQGMVVKRGFVPPPVLWDPRVLAYTDGQLFDIVTHGIRNMPAYGKQIPEHDRWAIVAYVRALQQTNIK